MDPVAMSAEATAAVADLATRLGGRADEIVVVADEPVTWPDGSLGCPETGFSYAQALVPGRRIVLSAAGATYAYHSGGARGPFLCEHPIA